MPLIVKPRHDTGANRDNRDPKRTSPFPPLASVQIQNQTMKHKLIKYNLTALVAVGVLSLTNISALAAELAGTVQGAKQPIAGSTGTLFAAGAGAPTRLAQSKTDGNGAFKLNAKPAP